MKENEVSGTKGYTDAVQKFTEATLSIDFADLHRDFLSFIPVKPSRVLDAGAGIGRDASVFCGMGHAVTAAEPADELRMTGMELYASFDIRWVNDALPELVSLDGEFDFILASGVWHHLNGEEQHQAMSGIAQLLSPGGVFALTLRNGPAGVGIHVFPTDGKQTIISAENAGLKTLLFLENQPSLMKHKENVRWTKLVFQK
jgi:SAM-dependent methyltransferase